jgi:hypothetical protein
MSLLHLELNVPWAKKYFGCHIKKTFPTTAIVDQRVFYLKPFVVQSTWKEIL